MCREIIGDAAALERFCQLRSKYMVEVCASLRDMMKDTPLAAKVDADLQAVGGMLGRPGCCAFLRSDATIAELAKVDAS